MQPSVLIEESSGLEYLKKDNQKRKAIILFHGYGASMMDLYGLNEVVPNHEEYDWFFPNGHIGLNMGMGMMGRAWFPIDMAALEQAMSNGTHRSFSKVYSDDFAKAVDLGERFVLSIKDNYDSLIIGGFSQGSMITSHISMKQSKNLDGLILFSGNLIGQDQLIALLETSKKFPFFQSHGKQDQVLGYDYAKSLFELIKLGGHEGEFVSFDGGHEIPMDVINKLGLFLKRTN